MRRVHKQKMSILPSSSKSIQVKTDNINRISKLNSSRVLQIFFQMQTTCAMILDLKAAILLENCATKVYNIEYQQPPSIV